MTPVVHPPVVDRIAYVLPWGTHSFKAYSALLAPVQSRIKSAIAAGRCERKYFPGSRYRESFHLNLNSGAKALVQIGAAQPDRQNGGIRVMMNPAKLGDGDVRQFNRIMSRIVGDDYDELMERPLVNCLDFAVDIHYLLLNDLLVHYKGAHQFTLFCQRFDAYGVINGYNIGSASSAYMDAIYSKSTERTHAALLSIAKEGLNTEALTANALKQMKRVKDGPDVVRVEIRGKKMRGTKLHQLASLPNRFERFSFAHLNAGGPELPTLVTKAFHAMCRQDGVKAALATFKHSDHARVVNAYWRNRQCGWWQPKPMWQQACDAVRNIGLFPDRAFGT